MSLHSAAFIMNLCQHSGVGQAQESPLQKAMGAVY